MTFPYFWNLELADEIPRPNPQTHQPTTADRTHILLIERSSATPAAGAPNPWWPVVHRHDVKTRWNVGNEHAKPSDLTNKSWDSMAFNQQIWWTCRDRCRSWLVHGAYFFNYKNHDECHTMPCICIYIYIHTYTYIYGRVTSNWNTHVLLPSFG